MTSEERNARAYCHSIGANPDEVVWGLKPGAFGQVRRISQARWRFYVGARIQQQHAAE
jgi:hypothetical protein